MKFFKNSLLGLLPLFVAATSATPAHAIQDCGTGTWSLATISGAGFTCQKDDKIYSDFAFIGFTGTSNFQFTSATFMGTDIHTFQGIGVDLTTSASYSYKIAVDTVMAPGYKIVSFFTSTTTQGTPVSKTLADSFGNTVTSTNGAPSEVYSGSPYPAAGPITYSSSLTPSTSSIIYNFTDTHTQMQMVPPVPGPLPVLGAAAAFGYSRQIRRRLKKVA
jgi:CRISPR/Cas system endoribonuclease Cas6 (RAMP superfamily)